MQYSYWEQDTFFSNIDALIIGSGIVGLNAALHLQRLRPKWKITLLEKGILPSGASTKNAGFACFGSVSEILDDLQNHEEDEVLALIEKRWKGLQRLRENLGDETLDFQEHGSYELFMEKDLPLYAECAEAIEDLNQKISGIISKKHVFQNCDNKKHAFGFEHAKHLIWNSAEGQIHTGKMMQALIRLVQSLGITILNGIEVTHFEQTSKQMTVHTKNAGQIKARFALIATNGFSKELLPNLALNAARNQVLITDPIPNLPFEGCFHYQKGYVYFRNIGKRILLGGGRHLALQSESTSNFGFTAQIQNYLENLLYQDIAPRYADSIKISHRWSGILGVGPQKKPILQWINPRLAIAVRMGGMGVAIGSLVGEEAALLLAQTD